MHEIFRAWVDMDERFAGRQRLALFESVNKDAYDAVFSRMRSHARIYPGYIFALTMGTGKTILMATCIYYEFILANKFPKDPRYCHNALVFAPDKTVLQSLREIQTFDLARVVPPEYAGFLTSNLKFHFLDDAGTALSVLDRSRFNVIVSNTQKIILKKSHAARSATAQLFGSGPVTYESGSVYDQASDLYGFDEPEDESELTTNQRFEKLRRLEQLGIYVDEAHHAFGTKLAGDMGLKKSATSLRTTIDELAGSLERSGTHVVACYNYTGTPYVGNEVLPEVVYAYGLRDAIAKGYLKQVRIHGYTNTRSTEFVRLVVDEFLSHHAGEERFEGMLPKLAFFAATIDELQQDLRPAVEEALGLPRHRRGPHPRQRRRPEVHHQRRHPRVQPPGHARLHEAVHPARQQGPRGLELSLTVRRRPLPQTEQQDLRAPGHDALPARDRRLPTHRPRVLERREPRHPR